MDNGSIKALLKLIVISELLSIRHSYVNLDCFSSEDIDFMIEFQLGLAHSFHVCFYFFYFSFFLCTFVRYTFS